MTADAGGPPPSLVGLPDGTPLATWTTGPSGLMNTGAGRLPVVLLHGGPGLWDYLGPVASMLDDLAVVHRYDQRGCGRSGGPDVDPAAGQTMQQYVDDLDALRETWGHERWVVVGHSFGAALGLAYAAQHPEHTAALAYVSGVGVGDWHTPFHDESIRRSVRAARAVPDYMARKARADAGRHASLEDEMEWRRLVWATDYADTARGWELVRPMAETPLRINEAANRGVRFSDADQLAWAGRVSCPVAFVHGDRDPRPWTTSRDLSRRVAGATWTLLPECGHMPWDEAPELLREVLRELVVQAS